VKNKKMYINTTAYCQPTSETIFCINKKLGPFYSMQKKTNLYKNSQAYSHQLSNNKLVPFSSLQKTKNMYKNATAYCHPVIETIFCSNKKLVPFSSKKKWNKFE
jgi:hypothetical protein